MIEVVVRIALSESVINTRLKRPLAEKLRRHIRLAIKPRYLGNHSPQIKNAIERFQ